MTAVGMDLGYGFQKPHLRLTARGRAVFTTLAAIPVVIGAVLFALNSGGAIASQDQLVAGVTYEYVTVEPGGSLWAIAQEIAPTSDPRDVISDILAFNGMSSAELFPGQELALPTQYSN